MSDNHRFRGLTALSLVAAVLLGAGAIAWAQQDDEQSEGRVVQIGQADDDAGEPGRRAIDRPRPTDGAIVQQEMPELPKYWIGLRGTVIGDDDPLRAHLTLPAGQGLLVDEVVPDSPAAKAGLQRHDILLRANEIALHEMTDLVELVAAEGEKNGQISLDLLRHGERETVLVSPSERPADALAMQGEGGPAGGDFLRGMPEGWMGQLPGQGRGAFGFRNLGPGVIIGGQGLVNVPNGVAISIHKEDGKPARVTVKRGDETWEVVGDDPESLRQLPDDLRPFVEQMLQGGGGGPFGWNFQMPNIQIPEIEAPEWEGFRGRAFNDQQLQQRLDQMERQMNQLLERLKQGQQNEQRQEEAEQEEAK